MEPETWAQMQSVTFGNSVALDVTSLSVCPLYRSLPGGYDITVRPHRAWHMAVGWLVNGGCY